MPRAPEFFLTLYGSQKFLNLLQSAHTFAVFTRREFQENGYRDVASIISWLPCAGVIHLLGAEPGRNYSLPETLEFVAGTKVRATPATRIQEILYKSALERIDQLETGSIEYVMSDRFSTRPDKATNCIHAVSDLSIALASLPMLDTGIRHGFAASVTVFNYLRDWFVAPAPDADKEELPKPVPEAEIVEEAKLHEWVSAREL